MLEHLLLWLSGALRGAPSQLWCLLLAHWSWDDDLWWSVSVAKVLWLRQSLQSPAGCHGCICYSTLTISDTFVYMIHLQLCVLGAPQSGPELSQGPSSEHASLVVSHMSVLTGAVSTSSCLGGSWCNQLYCSWGCHAHQTGTDWNCPTLNGRQHLLERT